MSLSNIDRFDEMVGQTFALLYQSFPVRIDIYAEHFLGSDKVFDPNGFTGSEMTDEAVFCVACLHWLVDAEYISAELSVPYGLKAAVLTGKGLETLKSVPTSLEGSIGERMIEATKTEGREALRSLVSQALGVGIQLMSR